MKKILLSAFVVASLVACNKTGKTVTKLENSDQKASYAFGVNLGEQAKSVSKNLQVSDSMNYDEMRKGVSDYLNGGAHRESYAYGQELGRNIESILKNQRLEGKFNNDIIIQGMMDVVQKKTLLINKDSIITILNSYAENHADNLAKENLEKSKKFIEEKKVAKNIVATSSGLLYEVIKEGDGKQPTVNSHVKVKYTGKLVDGKVFDSTDKRDGEPADFPVSAVIPGWSEGLQLMKAGAKYRFYISPELGYGAQGAGSSIGPNEALIFDVELISVEEASEAGPQQQQQQITPEQLEQLKRQMEQQQQGN